MSLRSAPFLVAAGSLAALIACSARRSEPIRGPLPTNEAIERGHVAFDRHCDKCHQRGEGGLGPSLNDKHAPAFAIRFQVRKGLGAMPAFPECKLSDEELSDIVCYLFALRYH
jgi:mono/diheme cytochrome c family protein